MFKSNTLAWDVATATRSGKSYDENKTPQTSLTTPSLSHERAKLTHSQPLATPACHNAEVTDRQPKGPVPTQNAEQAWACQCSERHAQEPSPNTLDSNKRFHYVSHMQKSVNAESVLERALKSTVQIKLGELLGVSTDLQKILSSKIQAHHEYFSKPMSVTFDDPVGQLFDGKYCANSDTFKRPKHIQLELQLLLDEKDSVALEAFQSRYADVVKPHPPLGLLLAMTTGKFLGRINGINITCMVDTGSELNLMPHALYTHLNLPLDHDGKRWMLKGINGNIFNLLGCVCDAPLEVGGYEFSHHFLINCGNGKNENILGQLWLQWYSASIYYTRNRRMHLALWLEGDHDHDKHPKPSVTIPLCAPDSPCNQDKVLAHHRSIPNSPHRQLPAVPPMLPSGKC